MEKNRESKKKKENKRNSKPDLASWLIGLSKLMGVPISVTLHVSGEDQNIKWRLVEPLEAEEESPPFENVQMCVDRGKQIKLSVPEFEDYFG